MRYYCTFFLRSDELNAPSSIFLPDAIEALEYEDSRSPARLARVQSLRGVGSITRSDLPRYGWYLDTRKAIEADECDPFVHVSWLLSQLKPSVLLAEARKQGVESSLGFYWGGSGTGGGPFFSVRLAELLVRHQIGLDVGFYYEEQENGTNAA
jgi:hypothetical protein